MLLVGRLGVEGWWFGGCFVLGGIRSHHSNRLQTKMSVFHYTQAFFFDSEPSGRSARQTVGITGVGLLMLFTT
jgi:hypothetical protein